MIFNKIKTFILLASLSGLLMLLGGLFAGQSGIQVAFIMALVFNGIAYFFSDRIVLSMYRAQPLNQEQYGWIYDIVHDLAQSMHLPMPKLWLIHNAMANAFATGRNPKHASIALTTGIIDLLDQDELRGVLAHEMAHIYNRDILISTIAATLATAIGYLANMLRWSALWGSSHDRKRNENPLGLLLVGILMPIAAMIIQLAISRSREYLADETGAHACHDPLALASALEKLHNHLPHAHLHNANGQHASTASLFIVHPFTSSSWSALFSTHPPMSSRVARLRALYEKMFPLA
ncbi:MAG TPA: zinc metalloprotease HtpX [Candidatus Dependentiae bacterium]|nr:zinc metalloprotease HtpX [Candidatus Dependentiae bacterium]HRQ62511.1 zinc metalloprotease HtpX [Candidatus Dependentiae bacterium]